ncbi:MAG: hypothetical protein ABH834_05270 [Candidatus Altiarchaeota archaeon]
MRVHRWRSVKMEAKMKNKEILTVFILLAALPIFVSAATYYMSISEVKFLSSGPYAKGQYSLNLQVVYSAPAGVSTANCRAKVRNLPSGWAVRDDYNTNYKTLPTCSGSTTFDVMPTTTGTFDASSILVEVTGVDSSGQNTVNAATKSPSGTFVVQNQPVLALTVINTSDTSNLSQGDSFTVEYEVSNTGGADTADTSNLRLTVASTPLNSVVFQNGLTSTVVASGTLAAGKKVAGTATLKVGAGALSNNLTYSLTATADNTAQRSQASSKAVTCMDCLQETTKNIALTLGWNLLSIPLTIT